MECLFRLGEINQIQTQVHCHVIRVDMQPQNVNGILCRGTHINRGNLVLYFLSKFNIQK